MNTQKRPSWGGSKARAIRAEMEKMIIATEPPCCRCGYPVTPETGFQVDHWPIPRTDLPVEEWWNPAHLKPAHPICNMKAGGRAVMRRRHGVRVPSPTPPRSNTPLLSRCQDPSCSVILASFEVAAGYCPRHQRGAAS